MSPEPRWPWSVLGLDKMPATSAEVRRAYARALKQIDQARDIEGFTELRDAYAVGLSQRENRTRNAEAKRARKVAAREKAAAEAPAPDAAPLEAPEAFVPAPETPMTALREPAGPHPEAEAHEPVLPVQQAPQPRKRADELPPAPMQPLRKPPEVQPERPIAGPIPRLQMAGAFHDPDTEMTARQAALAALLHRLGTDSIIEREGERIRRALEHPLARDPDTAWEVRHGVAALLRRGIARDDEGMVVHVKGLDDKTLTLLLDRYGWLTDIHAFRQDFGRDEALLDHMATRMLGSDLRVLTPPPKPETMFGRARLLWNKHATTIAIVYVLMLVTLRGTAAVMPPPLFWLIVLVLLVPVGIVIAMMIYEMLAAIWRLLVRGGGMAVALLRRVVNRWWR